MASTSQAPEGSGAYAVSSANQSPGSLNPAAHPHGVDRERRSTSLSNSSEPPPGRKVLSVDELRTMGIANFETLNGRTTSNQYVELYRDAMKALREAHRKQEDLWDLERKEITRRVILLEAENERLRNAAHGNHASSTAESMRGFKMGGRTAPRSASTPGDFAGAATSHQHSTGAFSGRLNGSVTSDMARHGMESIAEEGDMERRRSVSFAAGGLPDVDINKALKGRTIPGHLIDKDLDGIAIKATGLSPATQKAILEELNSASQSPLASSPGLGGRPDTVEDPSSKRPVTVELGSAARRSSHKILQLPAKALRTYDAGHTPLAKMTGDEADDTGTTTGDVTPKGKGAEKERPPLEPHPSVQEGKPLRPPNERSDSYFNVPTAISEDESSPSQKEEEVLDEDPALTGPLSMPSRPPPRTKSGDSNEFLDKLHDKLADLSRKQSGGDQTSPPVSDPSASAPTDSAPKDLETEEKPPPLRLKQSMNFGSQFGVDPRPRPRTDSATDSET